MKLWQWLLNQLRARWFWGLTACVVVFAVGFLLPWWIYLSGVVDRRFDLSKPDVPSRIYARELVLEEGVAFNVVKTELELLRYLSDAKATHPGSYSISGNRILVYTRSFYFVDNYNPPRRLMLRFDGNRLSSLKDAVDGRDIDSYRLDPLKIATLLGSDKSAAERMPMTIEQMPPLLVAGLQAVEDRNFKNHYGVDPMGLARAMWANLRKGRMAQGGSTLTQQLVKNTILTPEQTVSRKLKEMGIALILERRYDKKTILEAYLNRVSLGQSGAQAVQGFPAAAEFYFGRNLDELDTSEVALLVGLLKAPTYYNPRRYPERALIRRNTVLMQFAETGLVDAKAFEQSKTRAISVIVKPVASRERYPAFVALVRQQLARGYNSKELTSQGLAVLTTLDPQAQESAEQALISSLNGVDKTGAVQGALVLTDNQTGDVLALVGSRDPRSSNFNNALDAKRQVGSLLKPFVYLLALSNPQRYALGSVISDSPLSVKINNNQTWSPQNYDRKDHGDVLLIDALAKSYNQAAARVGLDVGVQRLAELILSLGVEVPKPAKPAMILGAVELTPFQVTQLYQALASGGKVLPLSSVRAVLDSEGRALTRFPRQSLTPPNTEAIKLVTLALNETTRTGTAQALARQIKLDAAGKTGTSNDSRDSWYAGYTGKHLGVVWMGRGDNQGTQLTGASGALRAWTALFKTLPSQPLRLEFDDTVRWLPVDTNGECDEVRFLPVLQVQPGNMVNCLSSLSGG